MKKFRRRGRGEDTNSSIKERKVHVSHGFFVLYPISEFLNHEPVPEAEFVLLQHTPGGICPSSEADKTAQFRCYSRAEWNSEGNMNRQGNWEVLVRGFSPQCDPKRKDHDI